MPVINAVLVMQAALPNGYAKYEPPHKLRLRCALTCLSLGTRMRLSPPSWELRSIRPRPWVVLAYLTVYLEDSKSLSIVL